MLAGVGTHVQRAPKREVPHMLARGQQPLSSDPFEEVFPMSRIRSTLRSGAIAVLLAIALTPCAHAQARLSGMVFADAQDALQGYSVPADSSAFRFRRVQFTVDQDLDSVFAVRFQIEADDAELTSHGKASMFLKQVWLRWSQLGALGNLTMGLSLTPTWALSESYWGYRSLEKTIIDLQGFGFATDLGVALQRAVEIVRRGRALHGILREARHDEAFEQVRSCSKAWANTKARPARATCG